LGFKKIARCADTKRTNQENPMSGGKPRQPTDPIYALIREGRHEDFNRQRKPGDKIDLHGCNLRGLDLREFDLWDVDFSDCYLRQADLRGQDLRSCPMQGASLHGAHISGAYFPTELDCAEIELSVRLGTRMRYR
jgi:uncharacterized protein YjbI with pentapeptide repeats